MNETPDHLPLPIAQSSQDPDEVARELFKETGWAPGPPSILSDDDGQESSL